MTVGEAAEHFGISKEAIHNRIRRGSLKSVVENGIKMVVIDDSELKQTPKRTTQTRKPLANNDRYYKLLEEQNLKLQSRVDTLENETRSLRDQKEEMLIQEREKIERIYKEKDEQLKNILNSISSKFMLDAPTEIESQIIEEELLEAELEPIVEEESEIISLNKYLKKNKFSDKKIKKIKARFKKIAKADERVVIVGSKYYLDILKYDYRDLIK
ncbi:DNA-binding protein [Sulfurimonas sp.]